MYTFKKYVKLRNKFMQSDLQIFSVANGFHGLKWDEENKKQQIWKSSRDLTAFTAGIVVEKNNHTHK